PVELHSGPRSEEPLAPRSGRCLVVRPDVEFGLKVHVRFHTIIQPAAKTECRRADPVIRRADSLEERPGEQHSGLESFVDVLGRSDRRQREKQRNAERRDSNSRPHEVSFLPEEGNMARITGVGGVFFKAKKDRKALAAWYEKHLGVKLEAFG